MSRLGAVAALAVFVVAGGRASDNLTVGLDGMVREGPDRLVAFSRGWNKKLAVFAANQWNPLPVVLPGGTVQPRALVGLPEGRIASLWTVGKEAWLVAVLEQGCVVRTIPFTWSVGAYDTLDFQADSAGRLWLSADDPRVIRLNPQTGETVQFDLSPYQIPERFKRWNGTGVVEDGRGTIWIWSRHRIDNALVARGLFRVKGDRLEPVSAIAGFSGRRILELTPRDDESLWLFDRTLGLFILYADDLRAEPVAPPYERAFRSGFAIYPLKSDWLVLAAGSGSRQTVWRLTGGKWSEIFPAGGCSFMDWNRPAPASAEIASGRLLAASEGILFVPSAGGKPRLLDWRTGFPLTAPRQIVALAGDRFAVLSGGGSPPRWLEGGLDEYAEHKADAAAQDIAPWRGWAVDAQERVFTLMRENTDTLSMGNGESWSEIPLPESLNPIWINHVAVDARDRVWVFSNNLEQPVAVLEPDRKTWRVFDGYRDALVECSDALEGFLPHESWLRPIRGPRGEVAFRRRDWTVEFWDGMAWRFWKANDIVSQAAVTLDPSASSVAKNSRTDQISTPFFDGQGHLCVNTLRTEFTWKLGEDGRWTPHPKEEGIADMWTNNQPQRVERKLPAGFPHHIAKPWVATDNEATTWVAGNGALFRHRSGKTVAVFEEGSAHPFLTNPQIGEVRVDRQGNAWIKMGIGNTVRHVLVPTRTKSPAPVQIKADARGFVTLASRPEGFDLEWRIDEGRWNTLPPDVLDLGFLPPGKSRLFVRLIDDKLSVYEQAPVAMNVPWDEREYLAHLVGILSGGPSDQREAAVAALQSRPDAALLVLDHALGENPPDSWWLQAARQACQRASRSR